MESQAHIDLVNRIITYAKKLIPESEHILIQCDSAGSNGEIRVIGNYVPDVYYRCKDYLLIGEAKTADDFERKHSKEQYESYLYECQLFQGESRLVIAVPWQLTITAKNYFKRIKKSNYVMCEIVIINELGRETIV